MYYGKNPEVTDLFPARWDVGCWLLVVGCCMQDRVTLILSCSLAQSLSSFVWYFSFFLSSFVLFCKIWWLVCIGGVWLRHAAWCARSWMYSKSNVCTAWRDSHCWTEDNWKRRRSPGATGWVRQKVCCVWCFFCLLWGRTSLVILTYFEFICYFFFFYHFFICFFFFFFFIIIVFFFVISWVVCFWNIQKKIKKK